MKHFFEELRERGFVSQSTHEKPESLFGEGTVVGYIGFDPTADSLHVGHLIPIVALVHLQRSGGTPIALVGGATGLIGDPSGKIEARPLLSEEEIEKNLERIKAQLSRFLKFGEGSGSAIMVNNAEWFRDKKYIDFLREVGPHFSINRMIKLESVVNRLEKGLSYLEFNYMVLQAYDFLVLHDRYNCRLQMGGDDQWGNIVMGMELVRRLRRKEVCGITFPLLTTSSGQKMGKTERGAVWLDPKKTTPYEFYQYWINIEDQLVPKCLNLYTFLDSKTRKELASLKGAEIREAKRILAYEITCFVHGKEAAEEAKRSSETAFARKEEKAEALDWSAIPSTGIKEEELRKGIPVLNLLVLCGLTSSNNEGRKIVLGGGLYVNEKKYTDPRRPITLEDARYWGSERFILLRKGKKRYHRVVLLK